MCSGLTFWSGFFGAPKSRPKVWIFYYTANSVIFISLKILKKSGFYYTANSVIFISQNPDQKFEVDFYTPIYYQQVLKTSKIGRVKKVNVFFAKFTFNPQNR